MRVHHSDVLMLAAAVWFFDVANAGFGIGLTLFFGFASADAAQFAVQSSLGEVEGP